MPSITVYALGGMLLITAVGIYSTQLLTNELKMHHPALYDDIGRPGLFAQLSIRHECRFDRFILRREYKSISNRKVRLLGNIVFLCDGLNVLIFIYLVCFRYNDFHGWVE